MVHWDTVLLEMEMVKGPGKVMQPETKATALYFMSPAELSDVEFLLAEFPSLMIAFIAEETDPDGNITFFSRLTDGHCLMGSDGIGYVSS